MIHESIVDTVPYAGQLPGAHGLNGCASCGSTTGPFVPGTAHGSNDAFYVCKSCVSVAAQVCGWLSPEKAVELRGICDEIGEENERLRGEIAKAKENLVVPLAEVIDLVAERAKRSAKAPAKVGA